MSTGPERDSFERELQSAPLPVNATVRLADAVTSRPDQPLFEESDAEGRLLTASRDWFQLRLPAIGTFEVSGGREVVLVPEPGCDAADVAPYLEGMVAAVLLAQRGRFALHANAVRIAGSAVAICGPRGAGKSTAAMRLLQRGHALLADDFAPLQLTEKEVILEGTGRRPRVTPDTVAKLGLDLPSSTPQRVDGKLVLPKLERIRERLKLIVDLDVGEASRGVEVANLGGLQALASLEQNAYLTGVMQALWRDRLLNWAARVSAAVPVVSLRRPEGAASVDQVAERIERSLERLPVEG